MQRLFVTLLFMFSLTACCGTVGTTYYIDSANGSDENTGTSQQSAFQSLEKLNSLLFAPGDKILFRAGSSFEGQFEPKGCGSEQAPIIVDMYDQGAKPKIEGRGAKQHTLLLDGISYWEVNNLEITNTGANFSAGRNGVVINARDKGDVHHIYLRKLTVHGVNGTCIKNDGAGNGIYWSCGGDLVPTRFIDLRIEDCHVYNCQRNGITGNGNTDREKWYPSLEVVVRGNLIENVPGDGIVPIGCDGALVEWNIVRDSPDLLRIEDAAAGIWPWGCDNTTIQYNEVSGQNAKWDGQGFDSDYNCHNTTIRYNFSHDNAGGFVMICNEGNTLGQSFNIGTIGSRIYGNVSINDGLRSYATRPGWFSPTIHVSGPAEDSVIEDNLIIVFPKPNAEIDRTLIEFDNWGGPWSKELTLRRNHFWVFDTLPYQINLGESINTRFEENHFYGTFVGGGDAVKPVAEQPNLNGELPFHPEFPTELRERVQQRLADNQN